MINPFDPWSEIPEEDYRPLFLSGAMPVHNDAEFLRLSLPALTHSRLDELVFLLDRCSDNSMKVIQSWRKQCRPQFIIKIVEKNSQTWLSPGAEAFQKTFEACMGDIIYSLAADCIYDPKIFRFDPTYDMVDFRFVNRDPDVNAIRQNYELFLQRLVCFKQQGDIFAIKKKVWQAVGGFDDISEDLAHGFGLKFIEKIRRAGFKWKYQPSNSIHLRADTACREAQMKQGKMRAELDFSLPKVLFHSVIHVNPYVFVGWITRAKKLDKINEKSDETLQRRNLKAYVPQEVVVSEYS